MPVGFLLLLSAAFFGGAIVTVRTRFAPGFGRQMGRNAHGCAVAWSALLLALSGAALLFVALADLRG